MMQRAMGFAIYCKEPDGSTDVDIFADAQFSRNWAQWCIEDGCEVNVVPLYADADWIAATSASRPASS